ncbi:Hpt domain-containing protein [bacterium]|nr:Hpt domain-containing protein [bacterium]
MSTESVIKALEDVALLTVLMSEGDSSSLDMVAEALENLANTLDSELFPHLAQALSAILEIDREKDGALFVQKIGTFVSDAQSSLEAGRDLEQVDATSEASGWGEDLSDRADAELIVEFIEKHTSLLEEFSAAILEKQECSDPGELDEFQAFLKSYLHNLKGDAGSVGLSGVERVTHWVEDRLLEEGPLALTQTLLNYQLWVLSVCEAYSAGGAPEVLAEQFMLQNKKPDSGVENSEVATEPPSGEDAEVSEEQQSTPQGFTPQSYEITGDSDILSEFLVEAEDHLSIVESMLLEQESGYSLEDLDAIFRAVHSIKGGSAYFSLQEITNSSHITESLMDKARDGKITFNSILREFVLEYVGLQRKLLDEVKIAAAHNSDLHTSEQIHHFCAKIADYLTAVDYVQAATDGTELSVSSPPPAAPAAAPAQVESNSSKSQAPASKPKHEDASPASDKGAEDTSPSASSATEETKTPSKKSSEKVKVKDFVKIETERLDHLIEFIGEMVISSSMLIQNCRDLLADNDAVLSNTNQLERISREIQDIGMSMRLIPIKGLFQKMSRVVWDTAKKLGKDVKFEMEGEDTELDRSVIDKLADPLMHMVRNAVDHGVESIDERLEAGKTKQGRVTLSAYHSGGSIFIEIRDDGKGLSREKLVKKALERGLITTADKMSDEEVYMLIFAAGFSTAEQVTDVSGRGVGMDVVRRNIESMRGRVSIRSTYGEGSLFTIELPLTLAIIEGIETAVGEERYIIPSLSVVEFLRPTPDMIMHTLDRGETLKFRGEFLPIHRLTEVYRIPEGRQDPTDGILVVVEFSGTSAALLVDEVLGKHSAVIKGLGDIYKDVDGVSGCAILPDGAIGLILDVGSFVQAAKTISHLSPTPKVDALSLLEHGDA